MANEHGELRYDDAALPDDAERAALVLGFAGTLTCTLCGFGTANRLLAVTQDAMERGTLHQRPSGLGSPGTNLYTLWLRSSDNSHAGAWLRVGSKPTPEYLIEKGLVERLPDAVVVATFILLVDENRMLQAGVTPDVANRNELIRGWAERAGRDVPRFLLEWVSDMKWLGEKP